MKENFAATYITRHTDDGKIMEIGVPLEMTQEEFDQIVSKYGTGKKSVQTQRRYNEVFAEAKTAKLPAYELTEENFNRINTDGFEKAVVLLKYWADMTMREMFKKRNFRIEINYNAEDRKTDFAIYTPTECNEENSKQEFSED